MILLIKLSSLDCLLDLTDDHVTPSQENHEEEGYLDALDVPAHSFYVEHDACNVLYLEYFFQELGDDHVYALGLGEAEVVGADHRVSSLLAGINETRPWILDNGLKLAVFGVFCDPFDLIEQKVHDALYAS